MSLVLNVPDFWIYQSSEYASGFEYAGIMNIPQFSICQDYTGFTICLNNSWIWLIMSGYVWICLSMQEYAWICLNLPEWLLFLHFPISPICFTVNFLLEDVVTYLNVYRRLDSLKEYETAFLESSWKYFICFLFYLCVFVCICVYVCQCACVEGVAWILIYSSSVLFCFFLVKTYKEFT